ncbi:hypothetical protein KEM52_000921 [Ascosphaera acerosa]|nr:hypothetical protein KEM52_000921 [Ascosphaera acerosa]
MITMTSGTGIGTYNFQPRQPLVTPTAVRSPYSSAATTPSHSTTTSPRQPQRFLQPAAASGNGSSSSSGGAARPAANQQNLLQLNLQSSRQVRSPQSPLYVPAVLRQTERPARNLLRNASQSSLAARRDESSGASSPKGSMRNASQASRSPAGTAGNASSSSANATGAGAVSVYGEQGVATYIPGTTSSSASSTEGDEDQDLLELLDNETIVISKEAEELWFRSEKLSEVVGSPTPFERFRLSADAVSPVCDFPGCRTSFGIFMRRHHCRHCGHVFCASHTPSIVPLDQNARFHPHGEQGRACEMCHKAYLRWDRRRKFRLIEIERDVEERRRFQREGGASGASAAALVGTAGAAGEDPNGVLGADGGGRGWPQHQVGSFVSGSVPRDWSWSTF